MPLEDEYLLSQILLQWEPKFINHLVARIATDFEFEFNCIYSCREMLKTISGLWEWLRRSNPGTQNGKKETIFVTTPMTLPHWFSKIWWIPKINYHHWNQQLEMKNAIQSRGGGSIFSVLPIPALTYSTKKSEWYRGKLSYTKRDKLNFVSKNKTIFNSISQGQKMTEQSHEC